MLKLCQRGWFGIYKTKIYTKNHMMCLENKTGCKYQACDETVEFVQSSVTVGGMYLVESLRGLVMSFQITSSHLSRQDTTTSP